MPNRLAILQRASALLAALLASSPAMAANWAVTRVNHMTLTPPGGVTVSQMSGVTYLGPEGVAHRFVAAEQAKGELVDFQLTFDAVGGITGITNVAAIDITPILDFEGAAYTSNNPARNTVFLSEENNPGIREVNLASGTNLQTVTIPTVFTANKRANRGFESLARSPDGKVMWTANEQALTVDGPESTPTVGSIVRLLKLNVNNNTVTAGSQFAYQLEPIHNSNPTGQPQNGLSDVVSMPDGTLLALERSVAFAPTSEIFLNRIFEVDFVGATDVSVGPTAAGLTGQTYAKVGKQQLWSGAADGALGQNLEGLTLGPRLASGDWVLVGVVDNADGLSGNTVVAFTARANASADFDADGDIDGGDFLAWQRGMGHTIGATLAQGDADRDGDVDGDDLARWQTGYAAAASAGAPVPEPAGAALILAGAAALALVEHRRRYVGDEKSG